MHLEDNSILLRRPVALPHIGIEHVAVPLATLLARPLEEVLGEYVPVGGTVAVHHESEETVFFLAPRTLLVLSRLGEDIRLDISKFH